MSPTITVALTPEYDSIWQKCSDMGHEMKIAFENRRIFPTMEYKIAGLERDKFYTISIHMDFVDDYKLRFGKHTKRYVPSSIPIARAEPRIVWHSKGYQSGQEWMSNTVSFDHVRISGNKSLEADSENNVRLLSLHRYIPVLTVYENNMPIHTAKIQHMVFVATFKYHNKELAEFKTDKNNLATRRSEKPRLNSHETSEPASQSGLSKSTRSEAEEKVGIVSSRKQSFNNPETLESTKQSKFSGFVMEDSFGKDVPATSSVALPGPPEAGLSRSMATPESQEPETIKFRPPTPPSATALLDSLAFGALPAPVSSNLPVLTPPITPESHEAELTTPSAIPTPQQTYGGAPPAAVSPLCSTHPAPSPSLMNSVPINSTENQHVISNASAQYHSNGNREYKRTINKFSTKCEVEVKVGNVSSRKRKFISQETLEPAKQPKISGFMMKDLIGKDVPSTSSAALPLHSEAGSKEPESIKDIVPTPPSSTSHLNSMGFQQTHGDVSPAAPLRSKLATTISPLCPTVHALPPSLVAPLEVPMMPVSLMPIMVPLFNPFLNPLMVNMFPTQPLIPFNIDTTQTPPEACDDNIDETAEIDIVS
ncbi:hypothetical protein CAEBREN_19636 [Caenorhabditis brenneri]|uniref:T-box domain-containing protein n=1 Tax=Caenorhabditis brenneri TaxID=135651 RepID=G0P597_CAEBE|nr:hypothetical protein CAEBREN_19636 [Caenorhabditis brenneri]